MTQPDPPVVGPNRLRECRWEPCTEITIPNDWMSGVYVGKLMAERECRQSYVIFIVRDDRHAETDEVLHHATPSQRGTGVWKWRSHEYSYRRML